MGQVERELLDAGGPTMPTRPSLSPAPAGRGYRLAGSLASVALPMLCRRFGLSLEVPKRSGCLRAAQRSVILKIIDSSDFFTRVLRDGATGLGEAYVAGSWTSNDLVGVLTPLASTVRAIATHPFARPLIRAKYQISIKCRDRRVPDVEKNAAWHYDFPALLFQTFLDSSLTYSSASFGGTGHLADDLHAAQLRKLNSVLHLGGVGAETELLDVGSGWGSLSIAAAALGARVTSVNPARRQLAEARARAVVAGAESIDFVVGDHRSLNGQYDVVASIEMIEALGKKELHAFFNSVSLVMRPTASLVLQFIHTSPMRMLLDTGKATWIRKHIFPGGQILSRDFVVAAAKTAGLEPAFCVEMDADYARTLYLWRTNFLKAEEEVRRLGASSEFIRLWEYYLALSEAGFRSGDLGCSQVSFSKR